MVTRIIAKNAAKDDAKNVAKNVAKDVAKDVASSAARSAVNEVGKVAAAVGPAARKAARVVRKNVQNAVAGTLGLSGERMSKVDTAWLRMDCDSNLMMIVGVWVLRPGISYKALCDRIEERLLKYPRFTQRVVQYAGGATWVRDTKFDITRQVVIAPLIGPPLLLS